MNWKVFITGIYKMEQRKFLKLTKSDNSNNYILIPVDSIIAIEEMKANEVRVTFQNFHDIRQVFVNESIKDITQGFVHIIL